MEAYAGPLEHHGALKAHPGAAEVHPGAVKAHPGVMKTTLEPRSSPWSHGGDTHWTRAELGVCEGGASWAKNCTPYILIFTAILSLIEHVKTLKGKYLLKESFFQTILLKNEYFKVSN
jgi:hypothetical protein